MKKIIGSSLLFSLLLFSWITAAEAAFYAKLALQNPGLTDRNNFYLDVVANSDITPADSDGVFVLGPTEIWIDYNGAALSAPVVIRNFSALYDYTLNTSVINQVGLFITPITAGVGAPLPATETLLVRIAFTLVDSSLTSTFEFDLLSGMVVDTINSVPVQTPDPVSLDTDQNLTCLYPIISGISATNIPVGVLYSFTPQAEACSAGEDLVFAISSTDPIPAWLSFNAATGTLSGTPVNVNGGTTIRGIVIRVLDGEGDAAELEPFDLTVGCPAEPLAINNDPPATATVGTLYQFDLNHDFGCGVVTYGMSANAPPWLQLDPATGELSGTPAAGDVGTTEGIQITAADENGGSDTVQFNLTVSRSSSGGGGGGGGGCFISSLLP